MSHHAACLPLHIILSCRSRPSPFPHPLNAGMASKPKKKFSFGSFRHYFKGDSKKHSPNDDDSEHPHITRSMSEPADGARTDQAPHPPLPTEPNGATITPGVLTRSQTDGVPVANGHRRFTQSEVAVHSPPSTLWMPPTPEITETDVDPLAQGRGEGLDHAHAFVQFPVPTQMLLAAPPLAMPEASSSAEFLVQAHAIEASGGEEPTAVTLGADPMALATQDDPVAGLAKVDADIHVKLLPQDKGALEIAGKLKSS